MNEVMEKKIGIIGGGQLGKMMVQEAKKMGFCVTILDPTKDCPASTIADEVIISNFKDEEKIRELVNKSDITTFEIEHINTEVLKELKKEGHVIYPSPETLEIIQDKSKQKEMLNKNNIPTADWIRVDNNLSNIIEKFGLPVIQKSCKGGYDGRGVYLISDKNDIENMLSGDSFIEQCIDFEKEIAVMVSRSSKGEIKTYPLVEMIFDESENICDIVIAPAKVNEDISKEATEVAIKCVEALDGVGIFAVEMFLTKDKRVLVNEIAPRPHNSGHHTIEACPTSQFEQHLRAILGLPLGDTKILSPVAMVNILGEKNHTGIPRYIGLKETLEISGANLHIYGKKVTKPYRKMGHITILDKNIDNVINKANEVKKIFKVISKEN